LFCLPKTNNRPIIGRCWLSNFRYRLSANNRCTSTYYLSITFLLN